MYQYRKLTPEQKAEVVRQRISRGYPPHSPPHTIRDKELYFITAPCYEHRHHMTAEARRQQLQDLLFEQFTNNNLEILAWVILPNHYHLLVRVNSNFDGIGKSLKIVHGRTSRFWNLEDDTTGRKVWYSYYDRAIRSERHYYAVINYIHNNPVKHKYAESIYQWNQSSVNWYLLEYGEEWMCDFFTKHFEESFGADWDWDR